MKGIRLSSPRFLHDDPIDHSDMNPEISIRNHTDRKIEKWGLGFLTRHMIEEFIIDEQEHYNWVMAHLCIIEQFDMENYLLQQVGE